MPEKHRKRKKLTPADCRALEVRIGFIEGIVRRDPGYVDALQLLGDHYTQRGRYSDGLEVDERLARLEPGNPLVFYNLACSYSLTDQFDRAVAARPSAVTKRSALRPTDGRTGVFRPRPADAHRPDSFSRRSTLWPPRRSAAGDLR